MRTPRIRNIVKTATEELRTDHIQVRRLEKIIFKCVEELNKGKDIPFSDLTKITIVISEFIDTIHHSREEDSYFPCVTSHDSLKRRDSQVSSRA